jgi:2-methylisocitrate lyase-like PEP mutase family enzyme
MATQGERAERFRALHTGDPFVIPNPWDAGSARVLAALGFQALATTSSGFAFTLGRLDGQTTLDDVAEHVAALTEATPLPLSVDLENGYGREPQAAAQAITRPPRRARSAGRSRTSIPKPASTNATSPSSGSRPPWTRRAVCPTPSC